MGYNQAMNGRSSGILLHITSLPSPFGIGDLGPAAYRFADALAEAGQRWWQVLPVTPTDPVSGNSPYSSISAMAGNPLLLSPQLMVEEGWLFPEDVRDVPPFPRGRCDYRAVIPFKTELLKRAYERFRMAGDDPGARLFYNTQASWLDDFAFFTVIKRLQGGRAWAQWPADLRDRRGAALERVREKMAPEIEREKFIQYIFFKQWTAFTLYCRERGVRLIGDVPIYVNWDSADVWTHPGLFKLGSDGRPLVVAGVPPDYFSLTGQLWGNPIYRWDTLQETGYTWWIERLGHNLGLFDVVRLDHFRGFVGFWEVPQGETTAINGSWQAAPADDFFSTVLQHFPGMPFIAEDLGIITADVKEAMDRFHFPGMRILLFAFDEDNPYHPYLPQNFVRNCIVYTGTHDNNTARGWFEGEAGPEARRRFCDYLGSEISVEEVHIRMMELLMMSVADTVIIPMQDVLGLGSEARMNTPSVALGNWEWRVLAEQLGAGGLGLMGDLAAASGRVRQP
jgi:4-alpha-glucanotransferase